MKTLIASVFLSLTFIACNQPSGNSGEQQDTTTHMPQAANGAQNATDRFSMAPIVSAYLDLKNALTKDDSKAAAVSGEHLFTLLKGMDMGPVPTDKHKMYIDIAENAKENAEHISDNTGNIAHQREHFASLSKDVNDLIALLGASQPLYLDHCPMYNDGKGADWISETKDIRNPYYGAAMPDCGSVKKELQP